MAPETSDPRGSQEPGKPPQQGKESASEKDRRGDGPGPMALVGAGVELAASVAAFSLLGWWLDNKWHTRPWMMVIGLVIAMIAGTYRLWKTGKKFFD